MKYLIITGMSGAGKSTALKTMEDLGCFCVDNFPIQLLEKFIELTEAGDQQYQQIVFGMDVRGGQNISELETILGKLTSQGINIQVLFMDASDAVLVKRYKETRRTHPLAGADRIEVGIARERNQIRFLKDKADYIIDTSQLLTRELNEAIRSLYANSEDYHNIFLTVLSFGFKYGIPNDADLVFDVRFLPNPYYVEELRPKTGNDPEIRDFVMDAPEAGEFLDKLEDMLTFLIPNYVKEGKNRLVIAIGCTGGKHRSVTMANGIYERLSHDRSYGLKIEHRDLGEDAKRGK